MRFVLVAVVLAGLIAAGVVVLKTRKPPPAPMPVAVAVAPQQPSTADVAIVGDPAKLILQQQDVPAGLQAGGGHARSGNAFSQAFLNPGALTAPPSLTPAVLGVLVDVTRLDSAAQAVQQFEAMGGLDPASIRNMFAADASKLTVTRMNVALADADLSAGFRLGYLLQGVQVYEHRFRFTVANVLCNLIVSMRAAPDGSEPAGLQAAASQIAHRQLARIREG